MSFPVPTRYNLTDDKNETVVVYNDGREERLLPDPGCFSQENIEKFLNAWIRGNIIGNIRISEIPAREYSLSGSLFSNIFFAGRGNILIPNAFNRLASNAHSFVAPFVNFIASNPLYGAFIEIIDLGTTVIPQQAFVFNSIFRTLILRYDMVVDLRNINAFNSTSFQASGSGGEIYIPKALYDHLGDATELDYKAAANWSTIDGYGTITWRQIEGSEYEFNYADGTPIGSV